jgi:phage portal protein BeeE
MQSQFLRALCAVLQVPSTLFNDMAASTESNVSIATKQVYTNRIIPDLERFTSKLTYIAQKNYGFKNRVYKLDLSAVYELQQNRKEIAEIYNIGVQNGAYTLNEFRNKLGDESNNDPNFDKTYIDSGRTQLDDLNVQFNNESE